MMRKENHSRPILRLFSFRQAAPHGITCLCLLLLSPVVPFAAAQSEAGPPPNPYAFNAKFSPSMTIIIVVLISAFFFMGFFSIYIRQCTEVRDGRSVRPVIGGTGRSRIGPRGLDPAVIEMFPTFLYSVVKGLKIGKGTLECAVCLNEFEDDETLRLLPKCDHVFHPECIDAWLASHTTCPVCRANLVPEPGEVAVANIQIPYSNGETDEENSRSHIGDSPNQVLLRVTEDQNRDLQAPDVKNNCQIPFQNRPPRSGSIRTRFSGKFPRSHSTGHSVVQPGENCERFTLRLPEDIRKQIVNGSLSRTTSCIAFPTEGSSRRGYRNSWEGSSRGKNYQYQQFGRFDRKAKSDRWTFSMAPPFFSRTLSVKSPKVAADAEGSVTSKTFLTTVKSPFDCLSPKTDGAGQSSARPLV